VLSCEPPRALRQRGAMRGLVVHCLAQELTLYCFIVWPVQHDVTIDRTAVRGDGALKSGVGVRTRVIRGARQVCLLPAPPGAMATALVQSGQGGAPRRTDRSAEMPAAQAAGSLPADVASPTETLLLPHFLQGRARSAAAQRLSAVGRVRGAAGVRIRQSPPHARPRGGEC